jgi:glycosyltransferase involved in cell wall biosynthesis
MAGNGEGIDGGSLTVRRITSSDASEIAARLVDFSEDVALVVTPGLDLSAEALERIIRAVQIGSLVASATPTPFAGAGPILFCYSPGSRTPPSVVFPPSGVVALTKEALELVPLTFSNEGWEIMLRHWAAKVESMGMRHVAVPGLASFSIDERAVARHGRLLEPGSLARRWMASGSHHSRDLALETELICADLARRAPVVLIDGRCLGSEPSVGTHHVVVEMTAALAAHRTESQVLLVAPRKSHGWTKARLSRFRNVSVVSEKPSIVVDLVYRPYQVYTANELAWLRSSAFRMVISQLDLIAFSNVSYFPRASLQFEVRNLIRASLRVADAVTTISEFSRRTILEVLPDLARDRISVVPCGTDHVASATSVRPEGLPAHIPEFVFCLSATFWHKNRSHAFNVFSEMRRRGFLGHLVVAGPEPHHGSSADADRERLASWIPSEQSAVHMLGEVKESEKWWCLEQASAVLYPSVIEGFGLVPFEAALAGTPTLAHYGTGVGEFLGGRAELAQSWDAAEWADTLMRWAEDPEQGRNQVEAIRQVGRGLSWAEAGRQMWDVFDDALSRPRHNGLVLSEGDWLVRYPKTSFEHSAPQKLARFVRRAGSFAARQVRRRGA